MYEPVLILNANFEPIHVTTTRRAVGLIVSGKADLVLNGRGLIHTVSTTYPRPSIIRLARMVKRPRLMVRLSKREILRRDNFTCQYCGQYSAQLTIDHVLPRRLGGEHSWENLVAACPSCNHRKGGHNLDEVNMRLLRRPNEPPKSARYFFARHLRQNEDWLPFIDGW